MATQISEPRQAQLAATNRAARISARATQTLNRIAQIREVHQPIFTWARVPAEQQPADAALTEQALRADGALRAVEVALGAFTASEDDAPIIGSVLSQLTVIAPNLFDGFQDPEDAQDASREPVDLSAALQVLDQAETQLNQVLIDTERLVVETIPALERAADAYQVRSRASVFDEAAQANPAEVAACICTFPCDKAPNTGTTEKDFTSGSSTTFTIKAAGSNARRVDVELTARTNAQRGRAKLYISTNANLNLVTKSGPFNVDGPGPTSFRVVGCIGGFGDRGTITVYDLLSVPGLRYRISIANK